MDEKVLNRELFKSEKFQDEIMNVLKQLTNQVKSDSVLIPSILDEVKRLEKKVAELEKQLESK